MDNQSRNSIWKGLLLGICSTACVAVILVLVLNLKITPADQAETAGQTTQSQTETDAVSQPVSSLPVSQEVDEKLDELEGIVDELFLFEQDEQALKDGIYKGFMAALDDPYSVYYTAEEYKAMEESTSGRYSGIGVMVTEDPETGTISVVRPFPNAPGAEAGMLPGDLIVEVAGVDVVGMDVNTVVTYIKGEENTTVAIKIYRPSEEQYHEFEVERREIETPTVEHEMLADEIGYLQVTQFDSVTLNQFNEALTDLEDQGMKGLIIDLRDNPGGLLNITVDMLDSILPKGSKIVYTEDKNGEGDTYYATTDTVFEKPIVLLVNGNSASASEIFAGAVKDYGVGTLVGTTTFGKGIVQNIIPLSDKESAIKLTVSRYFTPSGVCIHGTGIEPDVEVELNEELKTQLTISHEEDNQLQKAIEVIKGKMAE